MANTAPSDLPNLIGEVCWRWGFTVKLACHSTGDSRAAEGREAARKRELDDLLTAVGATRDGQAFSLLFHHFRPRVQAQLARLGLGPAAAEV